MLLYIDPGTGSMLFSLFIGLISVIWFGIKKLILKIKFLSPKNSYIGRNIIPLVIYSEDKRYWKYFDPICRELDKRGLDAVYMTSSEEDPGLNNKYSHISGEFIGTGNRSYARLNFLKASILLATIPGLDVYQWKRSKDVKCYIHLPHAANAMTTTKMFGLDFYDVLFVSAQYQIENTRELEKLRGEPEKELVLVGVPYMDDLVNRIQSYNNAVSHNKTTTVLLAPSWGQNAILKRFGNRLIELLVATGYHVIIRPHPQSLISEKQLIDHLRSIWSNSKSLEWNTDIDNFDVLYRADIMISDFSGVVFEYALAFDKPVICVESEYDDSQYDSYWLNSPNWSIANVHRLGQVLKEDNLEQIGDMINQCLTDESYAESRLQIRDEIWPYRGEGAIKVVDYIEKKYRELTDVFNTSTSIANR